MQENSQFKVIIVGAGVTGLTLAHCLAKAGIDFVLLDKGVVAPRFGTTITLQPHGCRILHQLGCLDAVLAKCDTMGGAHCRDATGKSFASNDFFGVIRKFAGYDTRTLDRQVFLPMVTQYNAIVMASSPVPGIGAHDMEITSNDKYSFLLLCQPDWISIIVHSKLPEDQQCTWPTRRRYTKADMEALVSKLSERPVTDTVVFGELWKRRLKAQMISLEEGVLEHWTSSRIVLAGDAVHKVTPNSALGGNTAMEDAVVIANTLHALLARHPNKKSNRARAIVKAGGVLTRQQAYDGWKAYITQRWLTPVIGLDTLAQKIAGLCVTAPKLNYVDFEERRGILGWQDTMEAEKEHSMKGKVAKKEKTGMTWSNWNGGFEAIFPHISGVLVILWLALWLFHLIASEDHVPGFERDTLSFVEVFNTSWRKPY
ncbi:hypothetical protein FOXYS1_10763 [Fusarium oxysporum]|uniref:FAD-binding domain-containing protein n=1 Tax=Fusarium oxysporum TaxID=5507 RepID=A0A8H5EFD0_FUSOX|nr:hypothetical protein FOXYS1_10763 [Fusarium oxysporum]